MWNKINTVSELDKLKRNKYNKDISEYILVSSTKYTSLNEIYLVYYSYLDGKFHFPLYGIGWEDVKLMPVTEIDRWKRLPSSPKLTIKDE